MPCDLFISYSRRDNERGQVAALKAQIESGFRAFAGRDLRVFFDTHEIAGMDVWRQKIQRSLRPFGVPRLRGPFFQTDIARLNRPATGGTELSKLPTGRRWNNSTSPSASGWTVPTCRDSRNSPTNLIKNNPAFGGRVRELIELRHALNENC